MKNEMISIIVPIYNVERYLERCVDSLRNQTYASIEIILVDDGSKDGCPEICDEYVRKDKRIKVIHKQNGGLSDARNAGLNEASGKYVMYVDSDDYVETDACERLIAGMDEGVDIVIGAYCEITNGVSAIKRHSNLVDGMRYSAKEYMLRAIEKNEWYAPAWLNLYDKDFLLKNQLYYKVGRYYEDTEILPRLFLAAQDVVYIDYAFYNYEIRENSIMTAPATKANRESAVANFDDWVKVLDKVADPELQNVLYGVLVRYYLASARRLDIRGWKVEKLNFSFAWKYALNLRDRLKVFLFTVNPKAYILLSNNLKNG